MHTFLKIIIIIILVYYGLKLIGRYLLPWLLKKQVEKLQKHFGGQFYQSQNQQTKREGEVTVEYRQQKNGGNAKNKGEYVDYEEIQ